MKIRHTLKHAFIPHRHNDYKPHFFREVSVAILISIVMFLLGLSAGSAYFAERTVLGATISSSVLVDLTNESRVAHNYPPLIRSSLLDQAAELKAEDMLKERYFAHTSPKGRTPWYWFKEVGYVFAYAGENLAVNFTEARAVRDAWLASPRHKDNLLDPRFREIGMVATEGVYEGDTSIYVVQLFGTPSSLSGDETPNRTATKNKNLAGTSATSSAPLQERDASRVLSEALVKGEETEMETIAGKEAFPTYSTWWGRMLVGGSYYVQLFYFALFLFVLSALVLMVVIEVRRQHWKHIAYGASILLVITLSALINLAFF